LLLVGFFETFGAGWVYGLETQIENLGPAIVGTYMFANFGAVIVACGLWFGLKKNAVWGGFVALILVWAAGVAATLFLCKRRMQADPGRWTWGHIIYEVALSNVMDLRDELSLVIGYMPWFWAFAMKQIIPHILFILFINLARSENADGESTFGHYNGYPTLPFQVLGILCVAFAAIVILIGAAVPRVFEGADLPYRNKNKPQKELPDQTDRDLEPTTSGDAVEEAPVEKAVGDSDELEIET